MLSMQMNTLLIPIPVLSKMKLDSVNIKDCLTVTQLKEISKVSKAAIYKAIEHNRLDWVELDKIKLIVKNYKIYDLGK